MARKWLERMNTRKLIRLLLMNVFTALFKVVKVSTGDQGGAVGALQVERHELDNRT